MKKSDQTKDLIITSAIQAFYENGYQITSTKSISQAAGVSEALIFKYFKSKAGLLDAVINQVALMFKESSFSSIQAILDENLSFEDTLTAFVDNRIAFIESNKHVLSIIIHHTQYDSSLLEGIEAIIRNNVNPSLLKLIEIGINEDYFSSTFDPLIFIEAFKSLLYSMIFIVAILKKDLDPKAIQGQVSTLLKGVHHG